MDQCARNLHARRRRDDVSTPLSGLARSARSDRRACDRYRGHGHATAAAHQRNVATTDALCEADRWRSCDRTAGSAQSGCYPCHDLVAKITGASRAGAALAAKRRVAAARPDPRSLQTVGRALRRGLLRAAGGGAIVAWKLPSAAIHVWSVQVSGLGAPSVPKMRPVHWFAKSHGGGVAQLVRAAES